MESKEKKAPVRTGTKHKVSSECKAQAWSQCGAHW